MRRQQPTYHPQAPQPTDTEQLAAWKTLLGELINSAARLRFFPHRVMMFLALARLTGDAAERRDLVEQAAKTLCDFKRIVAGLNGDNEALPIDGHLRKYLTALLDADRTSFDNFTRRFTSEADTLVATAKRRALEERDIIATAMFVANGLFDRMNKVVSDFASELARVAREEKLKIEEDERYRAKAVARSQASIVELTGELNRVGASIHMICINTAVQAARSGDEGRPFKVIARQIQKLSDEVGELTSRIVEAIEGARG